MQPEINVLGLSIKTFGLFFALNFVAWGALVGRRLRELGKPVDWAYEMVAAALVGGLIGARGYWLLQNHESFSLGSVLGGSGLIWYGGLLGGVVFVLLWARWRGFLTLALVDMAGPGLALGYAIGRIGCQVSGDGDYGRRLGRAVGDGLSARHGAHRARRDRPPHADLRDARHGPAWPTCCGSCATACGPACSSRSTS